MKVFQGNSYGKDHVHSGAANKPDKVNSIQPEIKVLLDVLAESIALAYLNKMKAEKRADKIKQ
jgi:hypothetical protein